MKQVHDGPEQAADVHEEYKRNQPQLKEIKGMFNHCPIAGKMEQIIPIRYNSIGRCLTGCDAKISNPVFG